MRRACLYIVLLLASCHSAEIKYPPGGYRYPEHYSDKDTDFYLYPLKDLEPRHDSFIIACGADYFHSFNEPNLSIRPQPSPTFRLFCGRTFFYPIFITLTRDRINVKQGTSMSEECKLLPDTNRLTPLEKLHFRTLEWNFPIENNGKRSQRRQHRLDSLGHLYLMLYDPAYYGQLYSKAYAHTAPCYTYKEWAIKISPAEFDSLVDYINKSGFWQLPYEVECRELPTDASGFIMEVNIAERYKVVRGALCPGENQPYRQAWQALVKRAGVDSLFHLCWELKSGGTQTPVVEAPSLPEVKDDRPAKRKPKP